MVTIRTVGLALVAIVVWEIGQDMWFLHKARKNDDARAAATEMIQQQQQKQQKPPASPPTPE